MGILDNIYGPGQLGSSWWGTLQSKGLHFTRELAHGSY